MIRYYERQLNKLNLEKIRLEGMISKCRNSAKRYLLEEYYENERLINECIENIEEQHYLSYLKEEYNA